MDSNDRPRKWAPAYGLWQRQAMILPLLFYIMAASLQEECRHEIIKIQFDGGYGNADLQWKGLHTLCCCSSFHDFTVFIAVFYLHENRASHHTGDSVCISISAAGARGDLPCFTGRQRLDRSEADCGASSSRICSDLYGIHSAGPIPLPAREQTFEKRLNQFQRDREGLYGR